MTNITRITTELEQFYSELLEDSVLQERLKAATTPQSLSELAVELGKEKGYFFTQEEVEAAMALEAAMGDDYMEEQLSVVSSSSTNVGRSNSSCSGNNQSINHSSIGCKLTG